MKKRPKPKYKSHWDKNNPAEVARDKLRKEIKAGRIERPGKCELCGSTNGQILGHHWKGYAYPLTVWWVCVSCNTKLTVHDGSQTKADAAKQVTANMTDNANPDAKIYLRRHFLDRFHPEGPRSVFDCCQGEAVMWSKLRDEYEVGRYWGVDLKPKKGRLAIDSVKVLWRWGWDFDVVDVDTYGKPWEHWLAMLPNVTQPVTVFLTIGQGKSTMRTRPSAAELAAVGFDKIPGLKASGPSWEINGKMIPANLPAKIGQSAAERCIAKAEQHGLRIEYAAEIDDARTNPEARYLGVRLCPRPVHARS